MTWRSGLAAIVGMCFALVGWGQTEYTLTGTVSDTRGQMLPGAAVLVQEHIRLGVTTNGDGEYTITFPSR